MMREDLHGLLAELHDLWGDVEASGTNVKAKKAAVTAMQAKQDELVAFAVEVSDSDRKHAVADELASHAQHYWDMAAMYDRTRELADKAGEEGAGLIAEATMQVCRDVARRLKARAAEVRGIDKDEAAFRDEAATLLDEPGGGDGDGPGGRAG